VSARFGAEPFAVHERHEEGVRVVAVTGELDLMTAPELCVRLDAGNGPCLLVDLTDVAFCDSTGLRALMGAATEVRANGGRFAVASRRDGDVARLFEVVGAREHMDVHEDVPSALAALRFG
jgi:anti-sigma B factor antagonist